MTKARMRACAGPRHFVRQLEVGAELRDGARRYEVERVQHAAWPEALGQAWVKLIE